MSVTTVATPQRTLIVGARLLDSDTATFFEGELLLEDGLIAMIGAPDTLPRTDAALYDAKGAYLCPGLIDIHTHGRAGGDFVDADESLLLAMSRSYLRAGVTTVMPTLASAPYEEFPRAAARLAAAAKQADGARFLGIHLEGRYLNPKKRGAHAPHLLAPLDPGELAALHGCLCAPYGNDLPVRMSAAFELDADGAFLRRAKELGIALSLGHTEADYETARTLIAQGVNCFTHLFNAMPPLHHRGGGAVAACLEGDAYGEIICDGFHIAPHMVALAYRLLGRERTVLISDSMQGTACPDGNYSIAGMDVVVLDGKAYTTDGAIAGSTLDLLAGVRNLIRFTGAPLADALLCATQNPARAAGIDHRVGSLRVGLAADLILLQGEGENVTLSDIWVGGVSKGGLLS